MSPKNAAIITVRMTSSRMPGKVLAPILGKPALLRLVERLKFASSLEEIIVATSTNAADDPIEDLCNKMVISCYRGSEHDLLERILYSAQAFDVDTILYVCGDCPCADPVLVDELMHFFYSSQMDYASNCNEISYPLGQNLEVFSTNAIQKLSALTSNPWDREHVTEYMYTNPHLFTCQFLTAPKNLERPHYRLCVDLPQDHEVITKIYSALYTEDRPFTTENIINFMDANPDIARINQMLKYKKYRAAVVGLGRVGMGYDLSTKDGVIRTHVGGYLKNSRTKLECVCDPEVSALEQFKNFYKIDNICSDFSEMLKRYEPEIVSICTPHKLHAKQVIEAVQYPSVKAVFCEKPMSLSSQDINRILDISRKEKVFILVNYWMRYSTLYRNIKSRLQDHYFGSIDNVVYTYSKGVFNSGSHAINLMIYLFGKPVWVQAGCGYDVGINDYNIDGMMYMENGIMVHFACCDWRNHFTTDQQIYGSNKMIRIEENGRLVSVFTKEKHPQFSDICELVPYSDPTFNTELGKPMLNAIDEIIALLDGEISISTSTGEDELFTIKTVEAMQRSLLNKGERILI